MAYTVTHVGDENTTDYRCLIKKDGEVVSPLHDIPLWVDEKAGICNMIVEIPRGTNAKMEIGLEEESNSIKQDTKKGKLRFVNDVFPYSGYIWNYGAFPQTWENPHHTHPETMAKGDNDPLDVCDIGQENGFRGQVKQVKVLGTLALIDEGETDWKVIVIDVNDPRANDFNDITDVEKAMPGFTMATYEWFRTYKMPAGKPPNEFAFNGEAKNRAYALDVVVENYEFWKSLVAGTVDNNGVNLANRVIDGSNKVEKYQIDESAAHVASTHQVAAYKEPEHPVAAQVAAAQRKHYFSVGTISDVLALISDAVKEEIPAAVLSSSSLVTAVVQDGQASDPKEGAVWTVALSGSTFGLYQKASPHANHFTGRDEVKAAGFDLVAAGFYGDGAFTYNAGYGNVTFKDGKQTNEAAATPAKKGDDLLGEVAPLAFIAAYN